LQNIIKPVKYQAFVYGTLHKDAAKHMNKSLFGEACIETLLLQSSRTPAVKE